MQGCERNAISLGFCREHYAEMMDLDSSDALRFSLNRAAKKGVKFILLSYDFRLKVVWRKAEIPFLYDLLNDGIERIAYDVINGGPNNPEKQQSDYQKEDTRIMNCLLKRTARVKIACSVEGCEKDACKRSVRLGFRFCLTHQIAYEKKYQQANHPLGTQKN